jgi:Fic family protein
MKVAPPPKIEFQQLIDLGIKKIISGITPTITNEKGQYLHWDKLKYLTFPKEFKSIEEYWFFIKYSRINQYKNLPFIEDFKYILTDDIQQSIHEVDSKMHGSIESDNINQNKERYIIDSLISEAISSSQLEGASTTRKVAKEMLQQNKQPQDYSQTMIYNNYQAIKFIDEHKNNELTPELILELHYLVTVNAIDNEADAGHLRQDNKIAVYDNNTNKALYIPPDYQSLSDRLKILCDFANGNAPDYFIHPIIRAIVVHFILGFDHPFTDGNGRTARALFYWVMLKNNYWLFQYVTLSTYLKKSPTKYGKSFLKSESDEGDLTYFIISQLDFIQQAIEGLFDFVESKQNQQQQTLKLLTTYLLNGALNSRQTILIQHALKHSGNVYTIEGHKLSHHIGYKMAREDLLKLTKLNLLHQSKQGRAFIFIAPADLEQRIKNYGK